MNYSFPVSRWHKIVERLTAKSNELAKTAKTVFCNTSVDGYSGTEQVARINASVEEAQKALVEYSVASCGIASIRSAVAKANVALNVNALLAEQEALNRYSKIIKEILEGQKTEMVDITGLATYQAFGEPVKSRISYRDEPKGAVAIKTLSLNQETDMKEKLKRAQARMYAIADEINDLNRERVDIELTDDIAKMAGLI